MQFTKTRAGLKLPNRLAGGGEQVVEINHIAFG
jgi:hypothetical protein